MREKLCVFCAHIDMEDSKGGDYPEPATFECKKGRWRGTEITEWDFPEGFRKIILQAESCPDYDQVKV